jgi:hypothetical protein
VLRSSFSSTLSYTDVSWSHDPDEKPEDINQLIDAFLLSDMANLKKTKKRAVEYFKGAMNSAPCGEEIIFCENQIKKLVPRKIFWRDRQSQM